MIKKVDEELGVSSGHNSEGGFEVIEESNPRFHMATGAGYEDFHPELSKEKQRTWHDSRSAMGDRCSMRVDMHVIDVRSSLINHQ